MLTYGFAPRFFSAILSTTALRLLVVTLYEKHKFKCTKNVHFFRFDFQLQMLKEKLNDQKKK